MENPLKMDAFGGFQPPYFRKHPYVFFGEGNFLDHKNCGRWVSPKTPRVELSWGRIQCRDLRRILAGRCRPATPLGKSSIRSARFYGGSYIVDYSWVFWYKRIHWKVEFVAENCWWLFLMIQWSFLVAHEIMIRWICDTLGSMSKMTGTFRFVVHENVGRNSEGLAKLISSIDPSGKRPVGVSDFFQWQRTNSSSRSADDGITTSILKEIRKKIGAFI